MAKIGVSLKIDVSKIDKNRLFKGQKGTYLDATVFIDTSSADEYGNNGMIAQKVSKEEKDQGVKGAILGNCKIFWSDSGSSQQGYGGNAGNNQQPPAHAPQQQAQPQQNTSNLSQGMGQFDDDIPF